ncbi:hypothetical protein N7495_009217 [Penicillium taxi]|uniref:uncharacterized protein n=1 Tax=Penicillium taxi TaxID=168475 RepID=UPI0025458667|nr:uncharacterized protein N7495_009217 [Penicillium taxi]KAJ5884707.1 hypothetical protein N7495_009217 [Penicillium taxi]
MTTSSTITRGTSSLNIWAQRSKPKVDISFVEQRPNLVNSYTTGDHIEGTATITVEYETRFDEVEIVLQGRIMQFNVQCINITDIKTGNSSTLMDRVNSPGQLGSRQTFLKLRQPIEDTYYPTPRVLEVGRQYKFDFTFVVPDHLLPQVCSHTKKNIHVAHSHTLLPPTLGDPMLSSDGKTLLDDLAPQMSQISYTIRVAVLQRSQTERKLTTLAHVAKKVRIIPNIAEEPPIDVTGNQFYCLRKEKTVRRGFLRGKLGRIVASSSQPKAIELLPPYCEVKDTVSTSVTVQLRFDPMGKESPPRLGSIVSRLNASTFFGSSGWDDFPRQREVGGFQQVGKSVFNESIFLSTMCVESAQWEKHTSLSDSDSRCDSLQSTSSADSTSPPSAFCGGVYYTTSLVIPVTLPKSKAFVPTFHSCLISRTYSLELSLSYHTPNTNVLEPTVSLRLPVQITSRSKYADSVESTTDVFVTQEQLESFFAPRYVSQPTRNSVVDISLAPPVYSETNTT